MYFADMFCYGQDNALVGVTGIRGCMAVIYVGAGSMYAVHIPDSAPVQRNAVGRATFSTWVGNQEPHVGKGYGSLIVICNGSERGTAAAEAKEIKRALRSPPTTLYRINKHLGPNSGGFGADSVVTMVERVHATPDNPTGCAIWYKRNDSVNWIAAGSAESGQYEVQVRFQGAKAPSDLEAHWWRVSDLTASATKI